MAITSSAKKAMRSSAKKRVFNLRRQREMRELIKKTLKAKKDGNIEEANTLMRETQKAIDKATKRGIIKPNTASRKKSRLVKFLKS